MPRETLINDVLKFIEERGNDKQKYITVIDYDSSQILLNATVDSFCKSVDLKKFTEAYVIVGVKCGYTVSKNRNYKYDTYTSVYVRPRGVRMGIPVDSTAKKVKVYKVGNTVQYM